MDSSTTQLRVRMCSKCTGDTEYSCVTCSCDLCVQCKENHVQDLRTIDHSVSLYQEHFNSTQIQETCWKHRSKELKTYCQPCQTPLCESCTGHKFYKFPKSLLRKNKHKMLELQKVYRSKQIQCKNTLHVLRSESLFYRSVLLAGIKKDVQICQTEFSICHSQMLTKATQMKTSIDNELNNFYFERKCLENKLKVNKHIVKIQRYEHRYVQSAKTSVKFLLHIKQSHLPPSVHQTQFSMIQKETLKSLFGVQITEKGKRRVGNDRLFKMMSNPELHHSLTLANDNNCGHISFVSSDLFWISSETNLVLKNTSGDTKFLVQDVIHKRYAGVHTVTNNSELIYINRNLDIRKLSKDLTISTVVQRTDSTWTPYCIYSSPSTGDLLVGMYSVDMKSIYKPMINKGIVARFNQTGLLKQIIAHKKNKKKLYNKPCYIAENRNGDIIVYDVFLRGSLASIEVTDQCGKYRFRIPCKKSCGICTDALSNILVCDAESRTVILFDMDGQFLSSVLSRPFGTISPSGLSYDINTHRLLVGSSSNEIHFYRYLTRQGVIAGKFSHLLGTSMHK